MSSSTRILWSLTALFSLLAIASGRQLAVRGPQRAVDSPDGSPQSFVLAEDTRVPLDLGPSGPDSALGASVCPSPVQSFVLSGVLPEGDTPSAVAFTPDGAQLLVAHRDSRNLVVFDAATRTVTGTISLSGSPQALAISPDGTRAVTANIFESTASIVDLAAGLETAAVAVGTLPGVVRITPDGSTAVVGNTGEESLSVIDIATATELRRIPGTGFTSILSFSPEPGVITIEYTQFECVDDSTVIHPDFDNTEIDFFDITAGTVSSLASAANPRGISITPDRAKAVVSHTGNTRQISVIDTFAQQITKTIDTASDIQTPIAIRADGSQAIAHVLNASVVVDLATDAISAPLDTASLSGFVNLPDGVRVMGVGFRGPLISYPAQTILSQLNNVVSTRLGAVAPTGDRAAQVANLFGEDLLLFDTSGSGSLAGQVPSGPPPEADKTRIAAVSVDGTRAVTTNILSDTASIIDLTTGTVEAVLAVGNRPAEVEITPDGALAVVANLDSSFASVIDLAAQTVTNVPISTRASQVEISPDGAFAYVAVVASGDGVWRINLSTLTTQGPKRATGNMGGVGYGFSQTSGLTLSHDGATLAVCGSFDDVLTLIDTASWSVLANVPVGDFPTRAIFSADDATIFVANRDSDRISIVRNDGATSTQTGTVQVGDGPFEMQLSPDGATLWVANFFAENIGVVDVASTTMTTTIPVTENPQGLKLSPSGTCLYASSGTWTATFGPGVFEIATFGYLAIIDTATNTVSEELDTGLPPGMLAVDPAVTVGAVPSPFGDGLTILGLQDALGDRLCTPATTNSSGRAGRIVVTGSAFIADDDLLLTATGLPAESNVGYFVMGTGTNTFVPPGSAGPICVMPGLRRFLPPVSDTAELGGGFVRSIGTSGPISGLITPGSTWNFQAWHRDGGGPTNFTDAVSVLFQ